MKIDIFKLPPGFKLEMCKEDLIAFAEVLLKNKSSIPADNILSNGKPLSVKEVATFLNVSIQHIYFLTSTKAIPHQKKGKRLYFDLQEIKAWLAEGKQIDKTDIDALADAYLNKKR